MIIYTILEILKSKNQRRLWFISARLARRGIKVDVLFSTKSIKRLYFNDTTGKAYTC